MTDHGPIFLKLSRAGLNQITRLEEGATKTPLSYDLNGNLLDDGTRLYVWDVFNRLKEVKKKSTGNVTVHRNRCRRVG